jgi:hypothetical protein
MAVKFDEISGDKCCGITASTVNHFGESEMVTVFRMA